jgi:tRNA (guanine-N7-)-methyltransferase
VSERKEGQRLLYYGRRKGKPLSTARQSVTDTLLPRLKIDPPPGGSMIDVAGLFSHTPKEIWLEIGFGAGEHLATQAERNPDVGIIGGEVFLNGVASLIRYVGEKNLNNVRVFNDDVRFLLPALPDKSLSRVFVLFPDPWPKVRHAKRRFIGPENLNHLARLMPKGAELRIASDHPVYIQWVMEQVPPHPCFTWDVKGPEDWQLAPPDHVETRYQKKAIREGRKPAFFRFIRNATPAPTA